MLSRLSKLLGKKHGMPKESRGRHKEGVLLPQFKRSRQKWSWGIHSEFWVRDCEVTGENGLQLDLPRVGIRSGLCLRSMGMPCFSEFLQNTDSIKDFR